MFPQSLRSRRLLLITVLPLLVIGIALAIIFGTTQQELTPTPSASATPQDTQVSGVLTCLPHKDTSGPTTLECAYGIKTQSGLYYALDTSVFFPSIITETPMDVSVTITGQLTPVNESSNAQLKKYAIEGIILVSDVVRND